MRSQASRITVTLVLLTCFVCPLLETFDTWDHTVQTGNDTEYALVVLALCVGAAYSAARFIFKSSITHRQTRSGINPSVTARRRAAGPVRSDQTDFFGLPRFIGNG